LGQVSAKYEVLRKPDPDHGYSEPYKLLEATPFRRMIQDRKSHHFVPFDEALPHPTSPAVPETFGGTANEPASSSSSLPPAAQEAALLLSQIRFINEFPAPSAIRLLLANMTFYPGFDVSRFSNLRTKASEIRPPSFLSVNGDNLGTVLHEILTRYDFKTAADELRQFLGAAYASFEEIHCDTAFGTPPQVVVRLREKGMSRSMELWELSDGMLRFLCLATALLNPTVSPFVAIDEPEVGLHPRLLPIVGDMIKTAAERTQVLVTTHSPDLLSRFAIEDVAVMARVADAPRAAWLRPADRKTLVQMVKTVSGENLGELQRSGELEAIG
jgi:predicted ATPase